jgi:hypothetical protein
VDTISPLSGNASDTENRLIEQTAGISFAAAIIAGGLQILN